MRKLGAVAQVAVTLACGWIVWVNTVNPRLRRDSLGLKLNPAIDLSCCSSIQVVVSSAPGPEPNRLLADLIVIDATRKPLLGRENYVGTVPIGGGASEALTFAIPAFLRSRTCAELEAVFHPEQNTGVSMARSSRVEVREIVLSP